MKEKKLTYVKNLISLFYLNMNKIILLNLSYYYDNTTIPPAKDETILLLLCVYDNTTITTAKDETIFETETKFNL